MKRPPVSVRINVNMNAGNLREFVDALNLLSSLEVAVGIPQEKATRKPEPNDPPEPPNNAMIGYVQEFGYPPMNIPARPFLGPGIKNAQKDLTAEFQGAVDDVFAGVGGDPKRRFIRAGLTAQSAVRNKIASNIQPALSKRTLAARRKRGRTGTMTLQDTGQMRNAVNFVVQGREEGYADRAAQRSADARRMAREGMKTK